jgi:predicted dehydrogenase
MVGSAITRRAFLRRAAVAGGAVAFPWIVPRGALAGEPGNTVTMGLIGCGGRMGGVRNALAHVKGVRFAAVCDVLARSRKNYLKTLKLAPKDGHRDFRELIERDDIDAVAIATPDHWHVPQAIAAIEAGKDVYCEKPLSNTVEEGRALVRAVERHGAVFQHGTQLHSLGGVRRACELVRNGRIGELKEIVVGSPAGRATGLHPEMPVPEGLDYDLWLGPAPVAPYTAARVFRHEGLPGWYFISDYSKAGWIAGYGVHDLDIAQWGMGLEKSGPVAIEGEGVYPSDGLFDTITTYRIEFTYANGVKIVMTDTGRNRHGVKFVGEDGWVFTRGDIEASPKSLLREAIRPDETRLYRSPGHAQNFIDCVRSRGETITPAEVAHRATSTALLGGIACRLGRRLEWDPERERFVGDPEADRLLGGTMRPPWRV